MISTDPFVILLNNYLIFLTAEIEVCCLELLCAKVLLGMFGRGGCRSHCKISGWALSRCSIIPSGFFAFMMDYKPNKDEKSQFLPSGNTVAGLTWKDSAVAADVYKVQFSSILRVKGRRARVDDLAIYLGC